MSTTVHVRLIPPDGEPELVAETEWCPRCGESRLDWLDWLDDDTVRCASCGHEYQPTASPAAYCGPKEQA